MKKRKFCSKVNRTTLPIDTLEWIVQRDLFHVERKEHKMMCGLLEVGEWEHVVMYGERMLDTPP